MFYDSDCKVILFDGSIIELVNIDKYGLLPMECYMTLASERLMFDYAG